VYSSLHDPILLIDLLSERQQILKHVSSKLIWESIRKLRCAEKQSNARFVLLEPRFFVNLENMKLVGVCRRDLFRVFLVILFVAELPQKKEVFGYASFDSLVVQ